MKNPKTDIVQKKESTIQSSREEENKFDIRRQTNPANSPKKIHNLKDSKFDWATLATHKDEFDRLEKAKERMIEQEKKILYR